MSHIIPNIWGHTTVPRTDFRKTIGMHPELAASIPNAGYLYPPRHVLHKAAPSLYGYEPNYPLMMSPNHVEHLPLWDDVHHKYQQRLAIPKTEDMKFQAVIDVQQFTPEEVTVKVVDDHIIVEGNHDEKKDDHGFIRRTFIRRYQIPEDCDVDKIESKITSDGFMIIGISGKEHLKDKNERVVPIQKTDVPACILHGANPIKKHWLP